MPQLQVASDKTLYVWQHMSNHFGSEQVLRDGPIHELPEKIDLAIGGIHVEFSDGTAKTVDEYFDTSTMDALLVLREGNIVFERYKTMRPFDKHNWFSCSKTIVGTSLALLEDEGKVDVTKPVSHYLPELAGSAWDTVTVEETPRRSGCFLQHGRRQGRKTGCVGCTQRYANIRRGLMEDINLIAHPDKNFLS